MAFFASGKVLAKQLSQNFLRCMILQLGVGLDKDN